MYIMANIYANIFFLLLGFVICVYDTDNGQPVDELWCFLFGSSKVIVIYSVMHGFSHEYER